MQHTKIIPKKLSNSLNLIKIHKMELCEKIYLSLSIHVIKKLFDTSLHIFFLFNDGNIHKNVEICRGELLCVEVPSFQILSLSPLNMVLLAAIHYLNTFYCRKYVP